MLQLTRYVLRDPYYVDMESMGSDWMASDYSLLTTSRPASRYSDCCSQILDLKKDTLEAVHARMIRTIFLELAKRYGDES